MADLKELLTALIKGQGSFEQANTAVVKLLARSPERGPRIAKLLKAARDAGLPHPMYVSLSGNITAASARNDADKTLLASEKDTTALDARTQDKSSAAGPSEQPTAMETSAEDATEARATAGDDATLVVGAGDDATLVVGADEDATMIDAAGDPDKTLITDGDNDFDIFSDEAMAAAESATAAQTGTSPPTAVSQSGGSAGVDREFREGDLLRNRFELISKLGEGGMGAVWKGKDRLKEEARDRNPYVAIKLLQGDFKEHPEAFIALQRETAKQQRLAHPNIATVFDFDRDDATNTVFMTMEVMEGQPMDSYVRKLPAGGLSEEEAMPLIEQLCEGLSYAHQAGLVHSDLKPGNCFYVRGEIVKLLDFGIARASKTKTDAEGEATLFDPGQLGALTPTYATIEMFEGIDPDPRDDIYALAIMAYQFLTGKHPYGKKSAPKAKELGLKVEPIAKLNKRQNKGFERGLAFLREDRTLSVEEFLEQIKKRKSRAPLYAGIAAAVAIVIGALSYNPIDNLVREGIRGRIIAVIEQPGLQNIRQGLEQATALDDPEQLGLILNDDRTKNAIVSYLVAGGEQTINETLEFMQQYDETWQREVKDIPAVKDAIFGLYEAQIDEAFNVKQSRYVFTTASEIVARLDKIYPDSARVLQIKNGLNREKTEELAGLNDKYTRYLDEGRLLPVENEEDIGDVIAIVNQVDPENPLIKDDRLRFRFGELTEQAIQENEFGRADNLLKASVVYAPKDAKLNDLRFQVQSELQRIANAKRVEEIEQRLGPQFAALKSLADFQRVRDDLVVLADLSPNSKLLKQAQGRLKQAFSAQLNRGISNKTWPENERLLVDFSKLFDIPYLTEQRQMLSNAEQKSGFALKMTPERRTAVDGRVKTIDQLLASPEFSSDWEIKLKIPYKELIALLPLGDPIAEKVRNNTARLYLEKAKTALDSERFVEATAFVDQGRVFYPGLKNFTEFQQAIASAEEEWRIRREAERRLARIEAFKNQFKAATERNDVRDANDKLASIRAEGVAGDDPFLATEAPQMLAGAYLRLAQSRAEGEKPDFEQALALAKQGLKLAPDSKPLQEAANTYEIEVKKRQLEIALRKRFDNARAIDVAATKKDMAKLKADLPNRYASLEKDFADLRGNRIRELANAQPPKISEVTIRVKEYNAIFPKAAPKVYADATSAVEKWLKSVKIASAKDLNALSKPLSDFKALSSKRYAPLSKGMGDAVATKVRALEKTNKSAAAGLLSTAKSVFPGHQKIASIAPIVVPDKNIEQAKKDFSGRLLLAALKNLATAKKRVPDHPDLAPLDEQVSAAKSESDTKYAAYAERAKKPATKTQQREIEKLRAAALGTCKDCRQYAAIKMVEPRRGACLETLAGLGKKPGGACWDMLGKRTKGPEMVVVPSGGGGKPFAIGKYEISGKDYNAFCKATGTCKRLPRSKAKLPLTGISVQQAETYAKWVSQEASKTEKSTVVYRLPTEAEWEHAAKAGGAQPEKKYNCRVTSGGSILSGHALIDAKSGQPNGWGLANYVGNAQEWVQAGGSVKARGGAFEDPLTKCDISNSRSHGGQPDPMTGFRLVRQAG